MSGENIDGITPPEIELPSALRIRQRLGMIATSQPYRNELIPAIEHRLADETMEPRELITSLEDVTVDYAEKHMMGMVRFVQNGIPPIIESLIDDTGQREIAMGAWKKRVRELTDIDEEEARLIQLRYTRPKTKLPRKAKKQLRRGTIAIDPKRLRR